MPTVHVLHDPRGFTHNRGAEGQSGTERREAAALGLDYRTVQQYRTLAGFR